jgi:hypothetical protein
MIIESKDSELTAFRGAIACENDVSPSVTSLLRKIYIVGELTQEQFERARALAQKPDGAIAGSAAILRRCRPHKHRVKLRARECDPLEAKTRGAFALPIVG